MSEPEIFTMEFQEQDDFHPDRKSSNKSSSTDSLSGSVHMTPFKSITQALSPEGIYNSESMTELPTTSSEVLDPIECVGLTRTASTGLPAGGPRSRHASGANEVEPTPAVELSLGSAIFPASGGLAESAPINIPSRKPGRKFGTASLTPPASSNLMSTSEKNRSRKESASRMIKQFLLGTPGGPYNPPSRKGSGQSVNVISVTNAFSMYPSFVSEVSINSLSDDEGQNEDDGGIRHSFLIPDKRKLSIHSQLDRLDRSSTQINGNSAPVAVKLQRSVSMPPKYAHEGSPVVRKLSGIKEFFRPRSRRTSRETSREDVSRLDDGFDDLEDVLPPAGGSIVKRPFKQTVLEDLPEGPEGETLTVHSTQRQQLADAARIIAQGEYGMKSELAKLEEQLKAEQEAEEKAECRRYIKNMFVLCTSFFFIFTSYLALRNLQSSLNAKGGLGMYAFSSLYFCFFLGCIFATTVVQRLRPKRTMVLCQIGISTFDIGNFYPSFYILVPISGIVGFSLGIIWTAHATYITNMAANYSRLTGQRLQDVLVKFNGMHFVFYQTAQIVGGLLSSLVLNSPPSTHDLPISDGLDGNITDNGALKYLWNDTYQNLTQSYQNLSHSPFDNSSHLSLPVECGLMYCPRKSGSSAAGSEVEMTMVYMLLGIFSACSVVGVLVLIFLLDRLEGTMKKPKAHLGHQLLAVFRFYGDRRVVLLVGLMFYSMLQASFFFGDFTKSFVTCSLGVHMVGYVMVCLAISSGLAAFINGRIQQYVGRCPLIITGCLSQGAAQIIMLVWTPDSSQSYMFFIMAAFWGVGDGILVSQTVSLMGTMFSDNKEPAFAALKMTQSIAMFSFFVTAQYLCTSVKVIIVVISLIIGMCGYVGLEFILHAQKKNKKKHKGSASEEVKVPLANGTGPVKV